MSVENHMAGINRFEDLIVWQKARALAVSVYRVSGEGPLSRDLGLRDQMRRSAVSIASNIAEGFERRNPGDFHRFLLIARASCAELRSQIYIASDIGCLSVTDASALQESSSEVGKLLNALSQRVAARRQLSIVGQNSGTNL